MISVSAVSAANDNATDVSENNQISDEIGNFTELNDEIGKITTGGNLTLKKDYAYDSNDSDYRNGIIIDKDNMVIDGGGHSIDGRGQARIFNITSSNVTLKNINFVNGHSSGNGGAVFIGNDISNCRINSTFINNTAYNGGAIYFNGAVANATINGYFEANQAERVGGAIYVKGESTGNIFASEFHDNRANAASGGAIFFYTLAEDNLFESVFRCNYGFYGAGIFFYSKANNNRFSSDFRDNMAKSCGGAMFFYNTTDNNSFSGCFINNSALGLVDDINGNGGAITFKDMSSNCVFTCDFVNNTAAKNGGGLNYRQTPCNITFNSSFINNNARYGGGINFFENFEKVIFNGEFIGNSAMYGGAIAVKSGIIKNTAFINNTAVDGGAIFAKGTIIINNSEFKGNLATLGTNHISLKENATIALDNVTPRGLEPFYVGYVTLVDVVNVTYGETVRITANITDEKNAPLNKGELSVIIGKAYTGNADNGSATIAIPKLNAGSYNVNVTYSGNGYLVIVPAKFKVLKQKAMITAKNKAYIINYGGKYSITLKDAKSKAISGKKVIFKLKGKSIGSAVTNARGVATISLTAKILKAAKSGRKNLVIQFFDSNYNAASKTVKITINKEKTKIVAKSKKFKRAKKVKKYTFTLKDSKGNVVKKASVSLKVKGKIYKAKTSAKGKATFKIKLAKKGKFTALITYKGNNYYNKVNKKVKITLK